MKDLWLDPKALDSKAVMKASHRELGAWFKLLAHCLDVENGGVIKACRHWNGTQFKDKLRLDYRELQRHSSLWRWQNEDLWVEFYPWWLVGLPTN